MEPFELFKIIPSPSFQSRMIRICVQLHFQICYTWPRFPGGKGNWKKILGLFIAPGHVIQNMCVWFNWINIHRKIRYCNQLWVNPKSSAARLEFHQLPIPCPWLCALEFQFESNPKLKDRASSSAGNWLGMRDTWGHLSCCTLHEEYWTAVTLQCTGYYPVCPVDSFQLCFNCQHCGHRMVNSRSPDHF